MRWSSPPCRATRRGSSRPSSPAASGSRSLPRRLPGSRRCAPFGSSRGCACPAPSAQGSCSTATAARRPCRRGSCRRPRVRRRSSSSRAPRRCPGWRRASSPRPGRLRPSTYRPRSGAVPGGSGSGRPGRRTRRPGGRSRARSRRGCRCRGRRCHRSRTGASRSGSARLPRPSHSPALRCSPPRHPRLIPRPKSCCSNTPPRSSRMRQEAPAA